MQRHYLTSVLAMTGALAVSGGCATKGYVVETVDGRVNRVEERVSAVEGDLSDTSAATKRNASRINEVDQTANTALQTANEIGAQTQTAQRMANDALTLAEHLERTQQQLLFEVVLSEDVDQFGFGDATLSDGAKSRLDALVQRLNDAPTGVQLEIQGHTDETGPAEFNERLGLRRAETVKHYLYDTHQVPLHKMNVISFGETQPVTENTDATARAKNRRVVVRVLGSEGQALTRVTSTAAPSEVTSASLDQ